MAQGCAIFSGKYKGKDLQGCNGYCIRKYKALYIVKENDIYFKNLYVFYQSKSSIEIFITNCISFVMYKDNNRVYP